MSRRAAVIGSPVEHSLSPAIHRAAFSSLGVDWTYDAIECGAGELAAFVQRVRDDGFGGLSVTMPLKEEIVPLLDRLDPNAVATGAVNCVSIRGGTLTGHNTDGDGCCDALESVGGAELDGAHAVVLGAGGTARSVTMALVRRGASVKVVNRTQSRADALVAAVKDHVVDAHIAVGEAADVARAAVLVNTTSVGMVVAPGHGQPTESVLPVDASLLHGGLVVLDAVYSPLDTSLLVAARSASARTVDGLWMLVHQARHQQLLWFGRCAPAGLLREESERELARRRK
ncbi:MAG: shikimate dehydrogenase [Actinomycetota bacterium]